MATTVVLSRANNRSLVLDRKKQKPTAKRTKSADKNTNWVLTNDSVPSPTDIHHPPECNSTATASLPANLRPRSNTSSSRSSSFSKSRSSLYLAHYRPVHEICTASMLSRKRGSFSAFGHTTRTNTSHSFSPNPAPSFAGFRHLLVIALVVGNIRAILSDYRTFGITMTFNRLGITSPDVWLAFQLTALALPIHLFVALIIERFASLSLDFESDKDSAKSKSVDKSLSKRKHRWSLFAGLHILNVLMALAITSYTVFFAIWNPLIGTVCEACAVVLCLKISSYALTNRDLRDSKINAIPVPDLYSASPYPANLTLSNLVYFWWAPTLVYQPEYPRTRSIRMSFVANRLLEMGATAVAMWFLSSHYAIPILENSLGYFENKDSWHVVEAIMRLSTWSIVIWLLGFFFVFQSYLNLLAEILRFGDREFYQDWWNAGSVATYWRQWNRPVSNYFKRHFYVPLLKKGYSQLQASVVVFLISAVLHEVLVGIPTKNVIGVAFMCMALQIPLIFVTAPLEKMRGPGTTIGNCIFWLSFFLGQPIGVLLYYYAWNLKHGLSMASYPAT